MSRPNYNGLVQPIASNRLIVAANSSGEVCFHTLEQVHIIVTVVGSTNDVLLVPNVRFDTRTS